MFGPFASPAQKLRRDAAHWLDLADRVWSFRRDRLSPDEAAALDRRRGELRRLRREKADAGRLKLAIESLEETLRRSGGAIYPKSVLAECADFFLVAAIVILGFRAYFIQPFKIPTNSMWPTYYGMTGQVFDRPADEPGLPARIFRFVTLLAQPVRIDAPADGEVAVNLVRGGNGHYFAYYERVPGHKWLIFHAVYREYRLYVGGVPVAVRVPDDFDFDPVLRRAYFGGAEDYPVDPDAGSSGLLRTGKTVRKGDRVLAFDILGGDQLFVDRLTYHFFPPVPGQGFVFFTGNIPALHQEQSFFIKRLVGVPGDTIEIKQPVLYRNGAPIAGAAAFDLNARKVPPYKGYRNASDSNGARYLFPGDTLTVPARSFFALGDNSSNSEDGRYWGFVPAADVVGRPLFIYYPFTSRWGPAR